MFAEILLCSTNWKLKIDLSNSDRFKNKHLKDLIEIKKCQINS